ncbi:hypothetical protein C368_06567 [Cryptococcus neoformans 125.91]|nr:hypothetical protein C368_06567 [Cryptococcus neoformans var. grubii 125.91]OXC81494.1 hypothetical protein C344_06205 [Cryptococcus neoformans var. grubii AD1-7a]OXG26952.1 hypothetical protein C360_06644 [Cryptococcus neoformans var. grubii Bt15]OXG37605.1 hypothetical protein C359_04982 [Cryptococcus neoformans var. grubii Bt120]OXG72629.1 hypothetical protein C350_06274 [Cryptococcus neoformans var. grubii MW-RSA36]OXH23509.1 hypothetical protein J005_06344 [Cryptococcus neoformans var.
MGEKEATTERFSPTLSRHSMPFFQPTPAVNGSTFTHQANRPPSPLPNEQFYLLHNPAASSHNCTHPSQSHHRPHYISHSIPTPQHCQIMHIPPVMPQTQIYSPYSPSLPTYSPPSYIAPASPPSYKPLPSSSDITLLLAPPPPFYQATCPHASERDTLLPIHSHSCSHCFEYQRNSLRPYGSYGCTIDWAVILLVLLNVLVWGAAIYGYWCEFTAEPVAWPS